LLDAMARGQIEGLRECSIQLIESCDLETTYHSFSTLTRRKVDDALMEELYQVARWRHGGIVELFRRVCEEERRTRVVRVLRSKVSDPRARFLLALLMLMPDRDSVFEAIQLEFPESAPMAAIDACIEPMSGKDTIGFDFSATNRVIFRGLVEGLDAENLLLRLQAEFESDSVDQHRDRLLQHARKMVGSPLFSPLFSQSPLRESPLRQEGKPHNAGGLVAKSIVEASNRSAVAPGLG
jgi:AcrR family transcriptional regulator